MLKNNCQQFGAFHKKLSINKQMIQYHGLHWTKLFIKENPVKFGYKLWMPCSTGGYPYCFKIYCGKDSKRKTPLGNIVMNMFSPFSDNNRHVFI